MANSVSQRTQQARPAHDAVNAAARFITRAPVYAAVETRVFDAVYAVACEAVSIAVACEAVSIAVHVAISR